MDIISFSGVDGSGKSTFAKRARSFLCSKGIKSRLEEPYRNAIYISIGRALGRFSEKTKESIEKISKEKKGLRRTAFDLLRKTFLFLDIIIFDIRLLFLRARNMTLVCDRYFFDILAHYILLGVINADETKFFLMIIPRPSLPILLTVNEEIAYRREGAHDSVDYYARKSDIYRKMDEEIGFVKVDSSGQEDAAWAAIDGIIKEKCIKKDILMVSRAVEPPWDEASKNLVRDIVASLNNRTFHILTTKSAGNSGQNVVEEKIYSGRAFNIIQKMSLLLFLLSHKNDFNIYHFCFTPEPFTSFLIRHIVKSENKVQNVPFITERAGASGINKTIYSRRVVVNSRYSKEMLERAGIKNVALVYPSVDTRRFGPHVKKEDARKKIGLKGRFHVLWCGKFVSDAEVRAISDIIHNTCNLESGIDFIIGVRLDNRSGKSRLGSLKRMLQERGLYNKVTFITKVDDMSILMAACDIMIYPFFSGFKKKIDIPYVIIEAMASAKPVIISDKEPLNEIVKCGGGVTVKEDSGLEFARAIKGLYDDEVLRNKIGSGNRESAMNYFDAGKNIKKYDSIYESLKSNG